MPSKVSKNSKTSKKSKATKTHHKSGKAYTVDELRSRIAKHNKKASEGKKVKTTHKVKGEHHALRKAALMNAAKKAKII